MGPLTKLIASLILALLTVEGGHDLLTERGGDEILKTAIRIDAPKDTDVHL